MAQLVLDIETVGLPIESFDEAQREYLLKWAEREETPERQERKREDLIAQLNLYPFTAQVVAIGMLNVQSQRGRVYYQAPTKESWRSEDTLIEFESGSEREILTRFWEDVRLYRQIITFNGRGFDCPFLLLRSAILGIKPSRDLMPSRFDAKHIDLLEELTFHGAIRRFNLDFYCKAFGITSPKGRLSGPQINKLFAEGKYREIAQYCFDDVRATAELYRRWRELLSFEDKAHS
ncbi:MAG: ribonuclease H-like domain-containing protein [Candidatus Bipolaricaulota bacterium]|nr:ribonuclease H-like domain-containing protein [Candidatus Bipolaricaulota bacterium]MDW8030929.1 ribonuclease H-like domain-containing protein [Candidatus Bipolaricaulota bacterium]